MNTQARFFLFVGAVVSLLLGVSAPVQAESIAITNAGFEEFALEDFTWTQPYWLPGEGRVVTPDPVPGWQLVVPRIDGGTLNPSVEQYPDEAPEGENVAYSSGGAYERAIPTLSQVLDHSLQPNMTYVLRADVGNRLDAAFPGYFVQLLAGGNVLAEDNNGLTPAAGSFATTEVSFTTGSSDPNLGERVEIRLRSFGVQTNFDDIRLDMTQGAGDPVPIAITNAGFEEFALEDFTWTQPYWLPGEGRVVTPDPVPGWQLVVPRIDGGTLNPSVEQYPDEAPEGENVAYSSGGAYERAIPTLSQVLDHSLQPNMTYVLRADVGNRLDAAFPGYFVQLLAGGNVLAEDNNGLTPAAGSFATTEVSFTTGSSDPNLGQPVEIRLRSFGVQTNFDDIRLDMIDAAAGPIQLTTSSAADQWPSWAPDGKYIVFQSDRTGQNRIFKIPPAGGPSVQLTFGPGNDISPEVSADGAWVAFTRSFGSVASIYKVPTAGGAAVQVSIPNHPNDLDWHPSWSPDGSTLYFTRGPGDDAGWFLMSVPATGGAATQVFFGPGLADVPTVSPDGTHMAMANYVGGSAPYNVVEFPLKDPSQLVQLSFTASGGAGPWEYRWDGNRLLYRSAEGFAYGWGEYFELDLQTLQRTSVVVGQLGQGISYSPDGTQVVYSNSSGGFDLWILNLDTGQDADGDGVDDSADQCPDTDFGDVVDADGCSITQYCPCDADWRNHGEYVSCVNHTANDFLSQGLITTADHAAIAQTAAQSNCGKKRMGESGRSLDRLVVLFSPNPLATNGRALLSLPDGADWYVVEIFDLNGRRIRVLAEGHAGEAEREILWDGRNDQGQTAASGTYFLRLRTKTGSSTAKILKLPSRR